jgi:hypothetical protein
MATTPPPPASASIRAGGRRRYRRATPPAGTRPRLRDELLKGCERPEDPLGDGGLMRDPKKALMQRMLGAELTEHLATSTGRRRRSFRPTGATA